MTPKEKAKELINKMESQTFSYQPYAGAHYNIEEIGWEAGKKCALIAVDEILEEILPLDYHPFGSYCNPKIEYWKQVKSILEKL